VIGHLFGSGLTIVGILSQNEPDDVTVDRLRDVLDELDAALRAIREIVSARHDVDTTRSS
jgi:hypothetical protein